MRWSGSAAALLGCVLCATPATAQTSYRLLPESHFDVMTHKAGLFGFLGHEHRIRAHGVTGSVVYDADSVPVSSLNLIIPVDSLEVLTPEDTSEIRQVTEAMRTAVLHPDSFPVMRFRSDSVRAVAGGIVLHAELTMEGVTRAVPVYVAIGFAGDTLHATARFDVRQTDFGIEPYGKVVGTVKVADRVSFEIDAFAVPDGR